MLSKEKKASLGYYSRQATDAVEGCGGLPTHGDSIVCGQGEI